MTGKSLLFKQRQVLNEAGTSGFMDEFTSYDYLYEAAKEVARRTKALTAQMTLTTVANQANYDLPADFLCLYITNTTNQYTLQLNNGTSSNYWLTWCSYERIKMNNSSRSVPIPPCFSIIDKQAQEINLTGTSEVTSTSSGGLSTLKDATTSQFANVSAGDKVYNTTDNSDGIVTSPTSSSDLVTALFNGTNDYWTSTNAYIIVPQAKKQIVLDSAPSVSGYTITVDYIQKPKPVYSLYDAYRFDSNLEMALVLYSCWLYKYRDRDPNFGDAMFKHFDLLCKRATFDTKRAINQVNWHFNMNKRSYRDRSLK